MNELKYLIFLFEIISDSIEIPTCRYSIVQKLSLKHKPNTQTFLKIMKDKYIANQNIKMRVIITLLK